MRILMVSNYYPPFEKGGYEQLCRDVANQLAARGHEVHVLTSNIGGESVERGEVIAHRLLRVSPDYASKQNPVFQFFFKRHQDEQHNNQSLRNIVHQFTPDVIFVWNIQGIPRTLAVEAESLPGVKVVYWLAGYSPAEPDEYWLYWTNPGSSRAGEVLRKLFGRSAMKRLRAEGKPINPEMEHTAVVSEFMRNKGIAEGTLPPSTKVIYNGVELEDFVRNVGETGKILRMLQAGRVSSDKGVHISIKALATLVNDFGIENIQLTIAGSGPETYQDHLESLIERENIGKFVNFLGWVPREQMASIMHENDLLLLPTIHHEPFARVVLEGMAAGLVVVAADTGGTSEIVEHNLTGVLCEAGDETRMAEQILRLSRDSQLRMKLAREGQQRVVAKYSLENMVDNIELFLKESTREKTKI